MRLPCRAKYHSADPTAFCKCYTVLNLDRPISLKAGEQCHLFNYTTTFLNPLSPDLICQRSCSCTASRGHRKAISLDSCLRCVCAIGCLRPICMVMGAHRSAPAIVSPTIATMPLTCSRCLMCSTLTGSCAWASAMEPLLDCCWPHCIHSV